MGRDDTRGIYSRFAKTLDAACQGNRAAFERLCDSDRQHRWLFAIVVKLPASLRGRIDPEGVLQNTLITVWKDLPKLRLRTPAAFDAWSSKIAQRSLAAEIRFVRQQRRDPAREQPGPRSADSTVYRDDETPSRCAALRERVAKLYTLLDQLPAVYRQVILYRIIEARTTADVAQLLNVSPENASVLKHRALKRAGALAKECGIPSTVFRSS